MQNLRAVIY
jgi:hypothetical protein